MEDMPSTCLIFIFNDIHDTVINRAEPAMLSENFYLA